VHLVVKGNINQRHTPVQARISCLRTI
jgi:hypothetical protein